MTRALGALGVDVMTQFVRFCIVGAIGFCVDTSILLSLVRLYGVDPYVARVVSYLVAATGTWALNRQFTFDSRSASRLHHEWARYISVNAIGGGVNYLAYALSVWSLALAGHQLILGVAVGAAMGLAVNFTASRYLVFRTS
jgi:putative flippase GtrA